MVFYIMPPSLLKIYIIIIIIIIIIKGGLGMILTSEILDGKSGEIGKNMQTWMISITLLPKILHRNS